MRCVTVAFALALAIAPSLSLLAFAQQPAPEKHVRDIRAEQPWEKINSSAVCDKVRAADHPFIRRIEVDPATLEPDLTALMLKSDEVILASIQTDEIDTLAPSGEDGVEYYDVKVLRSWKGAHKVGDTLTYALPRGFITCGSVPGHDQPSMTVLTQTGAGDWWHTRALGPYVLFLRQSRGEETKLTAGLRLTGGSGLQGLFALGMNYDRDCAAVPPGEAEKCVAGLDTTRETVKVEYERDPLKKKYHGMPVPQFLKEVQSVADATTARAVNP